MSDVATAPLLAGGSISAAQALWLALPIGIAFGAVLERAGLADPRKLAAQFTLTDLTVLKVMMTAIVTAALGLFWLGWAGMVNLGDVYVPPTFLAPQVIGGLIFGVGFVVGGYCPGTSCVAAASGRGDAVALMGGLLAGTLAFGEAFDSVHEFYHATSMGGVTWYGLAGLSHGAGVAVLVAGALAAFAVAERIERRRSVAPASARRRAMAVVPVALLISLATGLAGRTLPPIPVIPPEPHMPGSDHAPHAAPTVTPDSTFEKRPAAADWESPIQC